MTRSSARRRIPHEEAEPDDILRFLEWFAAWHTPTPLASSLTTCMTGRFKCSSAGAEQILIQAITLGMVTDEGARVAINVDYQEEQQRQLSNFKPRFRKRYERQLQQQATK